MLALSEFGPKASVTRLRYAPNCCTWLMHFTLRLLTGMGGISVKRTDKGCQCACRCSGPPLLSSSLRLASAAEMRVHAGSVGLMHFRLR